MLVPLLVCAGALLLLAASSSGSSSSSSDGSSGTLYTDRNGVVWRIWEEMPGLWGSSTEGYGGRWRNGVLGGTSYAQQKKTIDGNARHRDPKTGDLLPGSLSGPTWSPNPEDDYL